MTAIFGILGAYAVAVAAGFALYVLSFRLPFGGEILFYRGLLLAAIVALALLVGMVLISRRFGLEPATIIGAVATSLAFNVCFLVLFPVTIDRSISVFLLAQIEADQPVSTADLERIFSDDYVHAMRQIPRRVREQTVSGNIDVAADGSIRLTTRGKRFNALSRLASHWFGTDPRFVEPAPKSPHR